MGEVRNLIDYFREQGIITNEQYKEIVDKGLTEKHDSIAGIASLKRAIELEFKIRFQRGDPELIRESIDIIDKILSADQKEIFNFVRNQLIWLEEILEDQGVI